MPDPVDLELSLRPHEGGKYRVELRGRLPKSEALVGSLGADTVLVQFDEAALNALSNDPPAYGLALGEMLFADPLLRAEFAKARGAADAAQAPLRLRLTLAPDARNLHSLRWETLRDPHAPNTPVLTIGERTFFSRFLASADWQPVRLRARGDLRALVAIANPGDLKTYNLPALDVARELAIARAALSPLEPTVIGETTRCTLAALSEQLRECYDIIYLIAHASLRDHETWLFLEDEQGRAARVAGSDLLARVDEQLEKPRLVILAACQSAGDAVADSDLGAALTALGPRLAVAGVPAVLAMQGVVSVETVERLLQAFFVALSEEGLVDRALSIARGAVRERADFWMPVLFMRLTSGRIWYTPGFTGGEHGPASNKWDALIDKIRNGECTPILGPDMIEVVASARRDLARKLAEEYHFPLAPHEREGLPQVAQFLAVNKSSQQFPLDRIAEYLCATIYARAGAQIPPELRGIDLRRSTSAQRIDTLYQLLLHAWGAETARNSAEPYQLLAELPIPIYLTADPSDLLAQALRARGKKPREMICAWNEHTRELPSPFLSDPDYVPDEDAPLIFKLFGSYRDFDSLVLTEDNHFDYLIGVERYKDDIPKTVRSRLTNSALLFLGWRPEDWAFRVFFRILMSKAGNGRLRLYPHIAVQVAPEEGRMIEPESARQYLETYFAQFFSDQTQIHIFWGSAQDFARELRRRW